MIKRLFALLLFIHSITLSAQSAGEWIKFDQQYLKISLSQDGIYQITGQDLIDQKWDIATIDPSKLQLYFLGKELAVELIGAEDGRFDAEDRIQFYGIKNRGILDSLVYEPHSERMNKYVALFEDESHYFLTLGRQNGKRMAILPFQSAANFDYYTQHELIIFEEEYSFNNDIGLLPNLQQSYYERGEGWTGKFLAADSASHSFSIPIEEFKANSGEVSRLKIQLNGRSPNTHEIDVFINEVNKAKLFFSQYEPFLWEVELTETEMATGTLNIVFKQNKRATNDWFSVSHFELIYPKKFVSNFQGPFEPVANSILDINSVDPVYESSDLWNIKKYEVSANQVYVQRGQQAFLNRQRLKPKIVSTRFAKVNEEANYFILTAPKLLEGAVAYSDYRSGEQGGGFVPQILFPEELYDLYTYGFRNPVALRHFAKVVLNDTDEKKFLFLLGRPITFPDVLKTWRDRDLVPSLGYPASDVLLTAGAIDSSPNVQTLFTGRMNVTKNEQILNYLNKVKEFEAKDADQSWKQNFLHLSGGHNVPEINALAGLLSNVKPLAETNLYGAEVKAIKKQNLKEIEEIDISKEVNNGLGMISFAGHGSANEIDLNIGYCSSPKSGFANKGKYPLMFFNGCGVGNVFWRYEPLTTDWLITPDKGAIAVFANSFWSYLSPTKAFLDVFYHKLFADENTVNLSLGEIHQAINKELNLSIANAYIRAEIDQMVLQGDPAIKMFPLENPDFAVKETGLVLKGKDNSKPLKDNDRVILEVPLFNYGKYNKAESFNIEVGLLLGNAKFAYYIDHPSFRGKDTLHFEFPLEKPLDGISVKLNWDSTMIENSYSNNETSVSFDNWEEQASNSSFPAAVVPDHVQPLMTVQIDGKQVLNGDYIASEATLLAKLKDENAFDPNGKYIHLFIRKSQETEYRDLTFDLQNFESRNDLSASKNLSLEPGEYVLKVSGEDAAGNKLLPYEVAVKVSGEILKSEMAILANPVINQNKAFISYSLVAPKAPQKIDMSVYNSSGQMVHEANLNARVGTTTYGIPTGSLPAGIYPVKMTIYWEGKEELLQTKLVLF